MNSKNSKSKKQFKLDKHSSASLVLAFTFVCFMFTMFMASNQIGTSYAVPTNSVPKSLKFSGQIFADSTTIWDFMVQDDGSGNPAEPILFLKYNFKATDEATSTQYDMYCIEGQNATLGEGYYDLDTELESTYAPGLAFILRNSYPTAPSSSFMTACDNANGMQGVKPDDCKKYATQYAVWYYLDKMGIKDRASRTQLATGVMPKIDLLARRDGGLYRGAAEVVTKLATAAITYNSQQQTAATISINKNSIQYQLSEDGTYLESNDIAVSSNKTLNNYSVGFNSNNCDAKIVDVNGNDSTVFNYGNSFRIRIPVEKLNTLDTVDLVVAVTGSYTTDTVYAYKKRDDASAQRPIIAGYTDGVATVSITLDSKLVKIIKTDKETGKPVAGAVLAILGADGNEITRFTTTEQPYYLNLAAGNYLLKEITSPTGYELNSEEIPFTVTEDTTINQVEMKNTPTTDVPDTASNIPTYLYIIGSMILIIGLSVIVVSTKKNRNS